MNEKDIEVEIKDILLDQMKLLAEINKDAIKICEPELVTNNVLAMVEIAKIIPIYLENQEFDVLP